MRRPVLPALLLVLFAALSSGCWLVYEPCDDLEDRLCADLGEDCETLMSDRGLREQFIPTLRRKSEMNVCAMLVDDQNYAGYTLPRVRWVIASKRGVPYTAPPLTRPVAVDTPYNFSSPYLSLLPVVCILGGLLWSYNARKKAMAAAASPVVAMPAGVSPWSSVDSPAKVDEHLRFGTLVMAPLCPAHLGPPGPGNNAVVLPPAAAARKAELEVQIADMLRRGARGQLVCVPEYRAPSLVPARLTLHFGGRAEVVTIW